MIAKYLLSFPSCVFVIPLQISTNIDDIVFKLRTPGAYNLGQEQKVIIHNMVKLAHVNSSQLKELSHIHASML